MYGPLCNGATTLMFESTPLYPDASRYWDIVERHKVTQLYTAPTAIRSLMRLGDAPVKKHDLSSLRVLGSVGEPINPEAWRWYHEVVGGGRCSVVDTFWQASERAHTRARVRPRALAAGLAHSPPVAPALQTETGGHVITPLPGCTPTKAGSATLPCEEKASGQPARSARSARARSRSRSRGAQSH